MGLDGHTPQRIQNFGGLNTLTDPTNLPPWWSPNCQDVEFLPGLVKTRPGITSVYPTVGGGSLCSYSKTYINTQEAVRTLNYFLSGSAVGTLYKEDVNGSPGTQSSIATNLFGILCNSTSLFGREYMAFSDGKFGIDIPRQFDDSNGTNIFDRVSAVGPGAAPVAQDEIATFSLLAPTAGAIAISGTIAAGPAGLVQSGFIVTLTITGTQVAFSNLRPGDLIKVSGAGVSGYNGTFPLISTDGIKTIVYAANVSGLAASGGGTVNTPIVVYNYSPGAIPQPAAGQTVSISGVTVGGYNGGPFQVRSGSGPGTFATYQGSSAFGLAASGNGTATTIGNVAAGVHRVVVMFVDREGYISKPSPFSQWTAAGSRRVQLSAIPIGPASTVARIVAFSPLSSTSFYYDTGTNPTIFSSEMIIADNTTTTQIFDFSDALLLDGTNVDNLFDLIELGECAGVTSYSSRLFWWGERNKIQNFNNLTFDGGFVTSSPLGWTVDGTSGPGGSISSNSVWGFSYQIDGSNTQDPRGLITQSAWQDFFGAVILEPNIVYGVRARISKVLGGPPAGNVVIDFSSASTGVVGLLSVPVSSLTGQFLEYSGTISSAFSSIPSDLVLRVYMSGAPAGVTVYIDGIEIYPKNQPNLATQVRASGVEDPESYNGLTGLLEPAPENGQRVTSCFVIRNLLYMVKERSIYVTQDDGISEPNQWTIQEVSSKIGTPSIRGVGKGDEWAVIASESGLYYFTGGMLGEQNKLSKEIQGTWDQINWTFGHLISVTVDIERKRIYVSVPFGNSGNCNRILTLDYTEGFQEPQDGVGRKWCPWSIAANSVSLVERQDTTLQLFFGNSSASGKIYQLDTTGTVYSDDGAAIDSFWQTGFFSGPGRLNLGYISGNIVGSGSMLLNLYRGDMTNVTPIRGWTLNTLGYTNMERTVQKQGYRLGVKFETNAANQFFSMQGVDLWTAPAVWAPVRGINA